MLTLFRRIALVEGITNVALFFVAMPAKYFFGNPALVPPIGMVHGIAWLIYTATMVVASGSSLSQQQDGFVPFWRGSSRWAPSATTAILERSVATL